MRGILMHPGIIMPKRVTPVAITDYGVASSGSNLATYTFAPSAFGSPTLAAGKLAVVVFGVRDIDAANAVSSITESGNALSLVKAQDDGGTGRYACETWQLNGRAGAALGNIVVTWANTNTLMYVTPYLVENAADAASATASDTGANPSASLAIPTNGGAIGVVGTDSTPSAFAWSNMTEDVEDATQGVRFGAASFTTGGAATRSVTMTGTPSSAALALASWAAA